MKKLFAFLLALCLLLTMFGCKKEEPVAEEPEIPAEEPAEDLPEEEPEEEIQPEEENTAIDVTENVDISGMYLMDNGRAELMFYEDGGVWFVEGIAQNREPGSGKMDLGSISGYVQGAGTEYFYDDGEGKVSFVFSQDAMSVTVATDTESYFGCESAKFSGTYYLSGADNTLMYYDTENAGYMAAAMYLAGKEGDGSFTYNGDGADNAFAVEFLKAYVDLHLADAAEEVEGLSAGVKYYAFDENYLNIVLNTAFSEKFGTDKLITSEENGIVYNAHLYYVPCHGTYSGSVSFEYGYENFPTTDSTITYTLSGSEEASLEVTLMHSDGENSYAIGAIAAK